MIVERVLPPKAEHGRDADTYLLDLEMLVNTPGGRERTVDEFRELLTDSGFSVTQIAPTAAPVSVIEARPT